MSLSDLSPPVPNRSLVLLSGGIESTTLLHLEAGRGNPTALFVDYGQRAARPEQIAAQWQCDANGAPLRHLDMASVGAGFRKDQTRKLHVPLPHRNLVILSLAVSYATQIGVGRIHLALNREDGESYPSASHEFLGQFRILARSLGKVEVLTPLAHLSKAEIIGLGLELGIDYAKTYSCLLGYPTHCGSCPQCEKRRAAFASAEMADPAGFKRPPQ